MTAITAFMFAGLFAVGFVNAANDVMLIAMGFCMIFFMQLAGNSMQIFASEVFPTNARASGLGSRKGQGGWARRSSSPPSYGSRPAMASMRCSRALPLCW